MGEVECVVPAGDWTGEGAVWHAGENALYWVDINRLLVHRYDPETKSTRSWFFDRPPAALALTDRDDTLLVALGGGLILWQPANDARADFAEPETNWPDARMNDGRPDPAGHFWVGTMFNNIGPDGATIDIADEAAGRLFRVTANGASTVEKTGIGISNTFGWSPDRTRFYFGDTLLNTIFVWDYDAATGAITNERPFFTGFDRGLPDGSVIDSEGYLWNARYGGGCIVRVDPSGAVDRVIDMPVDNITTCTVGGPDLKTLYVTTAAKGVAQRYGGGLFALRTDVAGLPENRFRLSG
ncbi:SMP-30/gluconolactonase/LRE family protein [Bauldia sp.]|uniref:SMP-30/gluconolactonase/LRE family protein n=1 Tax=Bauldia sp. TaxID=2575872 RepID=UPI003BA9235C